MYWEGYYINGLNLYLRGIKYMDKIMDGYIDYMKNEKKLRDNTLDAYVRDILKFKDHVIKKEDEDYINTNKTTIITYLTSLQRTGKSTSTISRNLASIRCFFQYLLNNQLIDEDPTLNLKTPKSERKIPEILTEEEIDLLLSQPKVDNAKGARDKAMLELLYATGLKASEMTSINIGDIDLELGILQIRENKNNRFIPVGDLAIETLNFYLQKYRMDCIDQSDRPLFTNYRGNRLTRQGFWKIIKEYTISTNINKKITPNTLRHSFAVHLIENGANIKLVQEMLGHSDLSTTQAYNIPSEDENLREVYKKLHSRA